jgi:hypothetical protein
MSDHTRPKWIPAFALWSLMVWLAVSGLIGWILTFAIDPNYADSAFVQLSAMTTLFGAAYLFAARAVWKQTPRAGLWTKGLFFFWFGTGTLIGLTWMLPDPNRDAQAGQRYAIALAVFAVLAAAHYLFARQQSAMNRDQARATR